MKNEFLCKTPEECYNIIFAKNRATKFLPPVSYVCKSGDVYEALFSYFGIIDIKKITACDDDSFIVRTNRGNFYLESFWGDKNKRTIFMKVTEIVGSLRAQK